MNCSTTGLPWWTLQPDAGPILINVLTADLTVPGVRLTPLVAAPNASAGTYLQPLDAMIASDGRPIVGGINAGYFWRVDVSTFVDSVCQGKGRAQALTPASPTNQSYGVGDTNIVLNNKYMSGNCPYPGFSRPATLTLNGTSSYFTLQHRGDPAPAGTALDSVSAGPQLVTTNASGTYINIPSDDDNIGNILEHSANTAVGFSPDNRLAYLVTTDGWDSCSLLDPTCGTNAYALAYLMRDVLGCGAAMGMDQGGSTTMWVKGQGAGGIVSYSGGSPRPLYSGLGVLAA